MKRQNRIGIVVAILVAIGTIGLFAYSYLIESARADRIFDTTVDCIDFYGNTTTCIQICEGNLNNTAYHDMRLLNEEDCRPYTNDTVERLNL